MKLVALHHRLSGLAGHRYYEGLGLIEESHRRGWELELLISRHADDRVLRGLDGVAKPVFDDPTFDFTRRFEERVDDFVAQLRRYAEPALAPDCRVLLTVATQCEACALARWARTLRADQAPWFFVLFLSDRWNRAGARPEEPAEIETAAREIARLAPESRERFVLFAATAALASELSGRLRERVTAPPAHLNYRGLAVVARDRALRALAVEPRIALLGGSRPEKGSHRTPAIVAACRARTRARFIVQAVDEGLDPAALAALRALADAPDVTLIDGPLDRDEYEHVLAEADLLLCPYERTNYRQRTSGIFAEGVAAGLPAVVPSGTWLAEQIEAGRAAGVIYGGDEVGEVADAVARCVDDLGDLTAHAATLAAPWRDANSLAACLDAMERVRTKRLSAAEGATRAASPG